MNAENTTYKAMTFHQIYGAETPTYALPCAGEITDGDDLCLSVEETDGEWCAVWEKGGGANRRYRVNDGTRSLFFRYFSILTRSSREFGELQIEKLLALKVGESLAFNGMSIERIS